MKKYFFLIVIFFFNCDLLENRPDQVLARVNDKFIYESDLKKVLPDGLSNEDSILFAKNFINNWAKKNLLFEKALINLEDSKQNELNKLIESYKNDLFSFTYPAPPAFNASNSQRPSVNSRSKLLGHTSSD